MERKIFLCSGMMVLAVLSGMTASPTATDETARLRQGFASPPPQARAETWWHWSSLFVTRQGITADLESMKEIGYGAAHIFAPSMSSMPPGNWPQIMTPAWRQLFKHAAAEAKRLGLQLGVHNCPGWSSSGGPWIKPADSMQYLVATALDVTGPVKGPIKLAQPETRHNYYRDIEVYAFPSGTPMPPPKISFDFEPADPAAVVDGKRETFVNFPTAEKGDRGAVTFQFPEPYEARFAEIRLGAGPLYFHVEVSVSDDGRNFRKVGDLTRRIHNDKGDPKLISLEDKPVKAKYFRFTFQHRPFAVWLRAADVRVEEIRLLSIPMIADIGSRNSSTNSFAYMPPSKGYANVPGIDPEKLLRLGTRLKADGSLDWDAPAGNWTILRIGHTTTGAYNAPSSLRGLECDKLSKRGLDAHWPHMMKILLEDVRETGVLKYATIDSYEVGGQNWTKEFAEEFRRRRGYDLMPYLPAALGYVVGTPAESARFLYDFQRTVSDLFAENYYDYFTELCHKNGLIAITESYGGPFDSLRCARNADIPTGEFWIGWTWKPGLLQSSVANFHGRSRVGAEAFTTEAMPGRWQQDPHQLKVYGDRAWAGGISMLIMHSFVHQPLLNVRPGISLGRHGAHLNRNNTWWKYGGGWTEYIARAQYLLQQGRKVADLLVLAGESRPNGTAAAPDGYSIDLCSRDDLMENLKCVDGRLVAPSGASYAVLSLGNDRNLSLATLKKVQELLKAGATVAGLPPQGSPTLSDGRAAEAEYAAMTARLWGEKPVLRSVRNVERGRLIVHNDPAEIMRLADIAPDYRVPGGLNVLHRRVGEVEIYFLNNDSDLVCNGDLSFRVGAGKRPESWDPLSGEIEPFAVWRIEGNRICVPLVLNPQESRFVVFTPSKEKPVLTALRQGEALPELEIVKAIYRARGEKEGRDVTEYVRKLQTPSGLDFNVGNALLGGDPASNRFKELFIEYRNDGRPGSTVVRERQRVKLVPGFGNNRNLKINRAVYRARGGQSGVDVTEKVRSMVNPDGISLVVDNRTFGVDPAPNRFKELLLEYEYNGTAERKVLREHARFAINTALQPELPAARAVMRNGVPGLRFERPGKVEVTCADGKVLSVSCDTLPAPLKLDSEWHLAFPPALGAPPAVELPRLISWTEHKDPGVKYFSGTATYTKDFELPADLPAANRRLMLDLGEVRNLAEVELNGRKIALLWTPPFVCDVTEGLTPGRNTLTIRVTNLLVNRLIGDEQREWKDETVAGGRWPKWVLEDKPHSESGRLTWGNWKGWTAKDAPLPSGFLGPVQLRAVAVIPIPAEGGK